MSPSRPLSRTPLPPPLARAHAWRHTDGTVHVVLRFPSFIPRNPRPTPRNIPQVPSSCTARAEEREVARYRRKTRTKGDPFFSCQSPGRENTGWRVSRSRSTSWGVALVSATSGATPPREDTDSGVYKIESFVSPGAVPAGSYIVPGQGRPPFYYHHRGERMIASYFMHRGSSHGIDWETSRAGRFGKNRRRLVVL